MERPKMPKLENDSKGSPDSNLGCLHCESGIQPLTYQWGVMVPCVKLHFIGLPFKSKHHFDTVTGNQYETRSCDMSIKSRLLNSAIPPQSSSRGVLCVIIEFWVFMFLNTLIIQESNSVGSFC